MKKLYVGNLSFGVDEGALKEAFEAKGKQVSSVQIIMDRFTNRSRGFGFVELSDSEDMQGVIETMNGIEVDGRPIKVSEAQERAPRRPEGGMGGGRGGHSFGGGSHEGGGRGGRKGGGRNSRW